MGPSPLPVESDSISRYTELEIGRILRYPAGVEELTACWIGEASLVAQSVTNLPAGQETQVRSLGWEDPLEKEMVTHSSILAWKISQIEESGGLQSVGSQRVGHD